MWPKLDVPDTYTPKDGKAKTRYMTNLKVSDDTLKALKAKFTQIAVAEMEREGKDVDEDWRPKMPFHKNKETKEITVVAASGEKYKPAAFDSKNRKLPDALAIGGGSIIALDVTINPYTGFGGGVNLYINCVQVINLEEKSFGGKSRFEETEGYSYEGGGSSKSDDDEKANEDDDEIPF